MLTCCLFTALLDMLLLYFCSLCLFSAPVLILFVFNRCVLTAAGDTGGFFVSVLEKVEAPASRKRKAVAVEPAAAEAPVLVAETPKLAAAVLAELPKDEVVAVPLSTPHNNCSRPPTTTAVRIFSPQFKTRAKRKRKREREEIGRERQGS